MTGLAGVLLIVAGCLALGRAGWVLLRRTGPVARERAVRVLSAARAALLGGAVGRVVEVDDLAVRTLAGGVAGSAGAGRPCSSALMWLERRETGDVLVDVGAAPGIVSVAGDLAVARRSVSRGVRDLMARTTVADLEVTTAEDPSELLATVGPRAELDDPDEPLIGLVAPPRAGRLRLLVLWRPPDPAAARRLNALVVDEESRLAVLVVGDLPEARWRLAVDREGSLDLGVLAPVPVGQGSA